MTTHQPRPASRLGAILAYLALAALSVAGVWWVAFVAALAPLEERGRADLALAADGMTGELERYRELAVLLADHPTIRPVVEEGTGLAEAASLLLEIKDKTGSLDILVLDAAGRERARAEETPPENHAGRAYFERALDGALGLYHLAPERYGRRAFYFAAPIFSEAGPVDGAVLVAADVEAVEAAWRGARPAMFFTDDLGVVFLTNRSELLFRTREADGRVSGPTAEYDPGRILPFIGYVPRIVGGREIWEVDGGPYLPDRALHITLPLPVVDMTAEALIDVRPARASASAQAAVAGAIFLALGALLLVVAERRRALAMLNRRLEERVARRTAELEAAAADLRREVADRTAAEAQLKKAQADLVQAGKLSALGQMSAGISHELNQPLMAIRSFAENAEAFLQRDRGDMAAQNLSRIGELARRMGRIIRNLRAFARQESEPIGEVDLVAVVDAALEMAAGKALQAGAEIAWAPPEAPVRVRGGEVRLQQVVLNLVSNAIDAMEGQDDKRVEIAILRAEGQRVCLEVRDTGPGIAEPERIFDPFYTTKQVGQGDGMGLGLSISYGLVQSFGGQIRGRNHEAGGAVFSVELDAAEAAEAA